MNEEPELQDAIYLYYTITLNEWFARAMQDQKQFTAIARFVERPLEVFEESETNRYAKKYFVRNFVVLVEKLKGFVSEESLVEGQIGIWLKTFCTSKGESEDNNELEMIEEIEGERVWNEDVRRIQFDIFRPILLMLVSKTCLSGDYETEIGEDSISDKNEAAQNWETIKDDMAYLVSVKNIIANCEVQRCVQKKWNMNVKSFPEEKQ